MKNARILFAISPNSVAAGDWRKRLLRLPNNPTNATPTRNIPQNFSFPLTPSRCTRSHIIPFFLGLSTPHLLYSKLFRKMQIRKKILKIIIRVLTFLKKNVIFLSKIKLILFFMQCIFYLLLFCVGYMHHGEKKAPGNHVTVARIL